MNNYRYRKYCNQMSNSCNDDDIDDNIDCMSNQNDDCNCMSQNCNCMSQNCNCMSQNCNCVIQTPVNNCECGFDTEQLFPSNPMFAQSYVPIQRMNKVFNPEVGLKMGTIFPELVSPYAPGQSIRQIEYLKNSNEIGEGCNG